MRKGKLMLLTAVRLFTHRVARRCQQQDQAHSSLYSQHPFHSLPPIQSAKAYTVDKCRRLDSTRLLLLPSIVMRYLPCTSFTRPTWLIRRTFCPYMPKISARLIRINIADRRQASLIQYVRAFGTSAGLQGLRGSGSPACP